MIRRCILVSTCAALAAAVPDANSSAPELQSFSWLARIGDAFYVTLPAVDNWSSSGTLRTTWSKLRLARRPEVGQERVEVDFADAAFAESQGQPNRPSLVNVPWGVAEECAGEEASGELRVNLVGTPFAYVAEVMAAEGFEAHGGVTCSGGNQSCAGRCGGWCGHCGIGEPATTHNGTLKVLHRREFDAVVLAFLHPQYFDEAVDGLQNWRPPSPAVAAAREEASAEEPPGRGPNLGHILLVLFGILTVAVLAVLAIRAFRPDWFEKMRQTTSFILHRDDP